jgi:hypothetical protein
MLEKQQKNKKGKKVHALFNQVGFILIVYGEYNVIKKQNTYQVIYLLSKFHEEPNITICSQVTDT